MMRSDSEIYTADYWNQVRSSLNNEVKFSYCCLLLVFPELWAWHDKFSYYKACSTLQYMFSWLCSWLKVQGNWIGASWKLLPSPVRYRVHTLLFMEPEHARTWDGKDIISSDSYKPTWLRVFWLGKENGHLGFSLVNSTS